MSRFGRSGKAVLITAVSEAARLEAAETGDEHLLLACASVGGRGPALLRELGVTRRSILDAIGGAGEADEGGIDPEDAEALASVGIDLTSIVDAAEGVFGEGALRGRQVLRRRGPRRETAPLSNAAKEALATAVRQAVELKAKKVESEHLLLGTLRDPSPRLSSIMASLGLDHEGVFEQLLLPPAAAAG